MGEAAGRRPMDPATAGRLGGPVEADRLRLEPMGERHAEAFFPALQDDALYRWISMEKPASLDALRRHWRAIETRLAPDGLAAWPTWALRRRADAVCIGRVDAEVVVGESGLEATNFGYYLFPPHWGQGYATEAVVAATRHLVQHGVVRLVATVTAGNQASVRVLEKAGYVFRRVLKDHDHLRGVAVDDHEFVHTRAP